MNDRYPDPPPPCPICNGSLWINGKCGVCFPKWTNKTINVNETKRVSVEEMLKDIHERGNKP